MATRTHQRCGPEHNPSITTQQRAGGTLIDGDRLRSDGVFGVWVPIDVRCAEDRACVDIVVIAERPLSTYTKCIRLSMNKTEQKEQNEIL